MSWGDNDKLERLKRVLTMHQGIVVSFEELDRRVFAEQLGSRQYLTVLIYELRKQGWEIETHLRVGYKLMAAGSQGSEE